MASEAQYRLLDDFMVQGSRKLPLEDAAGKPILDSNGKQKIGSKYAIFQFKKGQVVTEKQLGAHLSEAPVARDATGNAVPETAVAAEPKIKAAPPA
ncbi:MAG: hypothetical protein EPN91_02140 [Salinibacterium sp.]|nr:MAG: hypothetical protein EPN91_02140 [Salinibacterium sp.]